jgi:hypothetical protein
MSGINRKFDAMCIWVPAWLALPCSNETNCCLLLSRNNCFVSILLDKIDKKPLRTARRMSCYHLSYSAIHMYFKLTLFQTENQGLCLTKSFWAKWSPFSCLPFHRYLQLTACAPHDVLPKRATWQGVRVLWVPLVSVLCCCVALMSSFTLQLLPRSPCRRHPYNADSAAS